jgi:cytochrome c553
MTKLRLALKILTPIFVLMIAVGQGCGAFHALVSDSAASLGSFDNSALVGKTKYDAVCLGCHGPGQTSAKAGATFDRISSALATIPAMKGLRSSLTDTDVRSIASYLMGDRRLQACAHPTDVGRTAADRLTNSEYDNTLRDLLGITQSTSAQQFFPDDAGGTNFTNEALSLPMSALLAQKYYEAAVATLNSVFADANLKARVLTCNAGDPTCVRTTLSAFLLKAFRRPPTAAELTTYTSYINQAVAAGQSSESGIQLAMTAALISPNFLYRTPRDPSPGLPDIAVTIDAYELATRLSYFIWSSMPDDALLAAAKSGALLQDATLKAQVQRMLKDQKANALVDNFAAQWFKLGELDTSTPDANQFPEFNDNLRNSMRTETTTYLKDLFQRDGSFFELLNSQTTFLDSSMASLYGVSGVSGTTFQRASLVGTGRRGIATQASILVIGSHPSTTSIVRRGKWVLANLLCSSPPPPPPNTPAFPAMISGQTQRQRLEQHIANPVCSSCHQSIDPMGYAFEHFDPLGRFRTQDGNYPVDSSGFYPGGKSFRDAGDLADIMQVDQRFPVCVSQMMFNFALARVPSTADQCTVNQIGLLAVRPDQPISAAIIALVSSDPFRMRRGEGDKK